MQRGHNGQGLPHLSGMVQGQQQWLCQDRTGVQNHTSSVLQGRFYFNDDTAKLWKCLSGSPAETGSTSGIYRLLEFTRR